jgi:hypothetical protein
MLWEAILFAKQYPPCRGSINDGDHQIRIRILFAITFLLHYLNTNLIFLNFLICSFVYVHFFATITKILIKDAFIIKITLFLYYQVCLSSNL